MFLCDKCVKCGAMHFSGSYGPCEKCGMTADCVSCYHENPVKKLKRKKKTPNRRRKHNG